MSFMTFVPIENNESSKSNWLQYVACIVAACASDGLSQAEKTAIANWLSAQGQNPSMLDEAVAAASSLSMDTVSANKATAFFGPYLVRDAIRMSRIDGLGEKERAAISKRATAVGVSAQNVKSIEGMIEQYEAAEAGWKSLLKS